MSSEFALSPPRKRPMELLRLVGWAVALAFLVWAWRGAEMRPMTPDYRVGQHPHAD